jgi:hypothetical protein
LLKNAILWIRQSHLALPEYPDTLSIGYQLLLPLPRMAQ